MGRTKRKVRLPPFVAMEWSLLNSDAYKSLSHSARACLPYWLGKPKKPFNDIENYQIEFTFSYTEGESYGFARATFAKIIREIVEKGFVDPVSKGGLRGDRKSYNRFALSKRWHSFGKAEFEVVSWRQAGPQ